MNNQIVTRREQNELALYDPDKGLKAVAVAEAAEKHFARAKDATKLFEAIEAKLKAQANYVVWRDRLSKHGGDRKSSKSKLQNRNLDLPAADPGDVVAHRWRKRLCSKVKGETVSDSEKIKRVARTVITIIDDDKIAQALENAKHRCRRICEQEKPGTVRGTEGTGEFERYTPAEFIVAAREALGEIDLDPATCEVAQRTVQATEFFTAETDGLKREWHGRVFLNPPYHRELAPAFVDKLIEEFNAGRVTAAVMLTNNSTDTEWFAAAVRVCSAICFTYGRIPFSDQHGNPVAPTQGQAFCYFGTDVARFERAFQSIGFGVVPRWSAN